MSVLESYLADKKLSQEEDARSPEDLLIRIAEAVEALESRKRKPERPSRTVSGSITPELLATQQESLHIQRVQSEALIELAVVAEETNSVVTDSLKGLHKSLYKLASVQSKMFGKKGDGDPLKNAILRALKEHDKEISQKARRGGAGTAGGAAAGASVFDLLDGPSVDSSGKTRGRGRGGRIGRTGRGWMGRATGAAGEFLGKGLVGKIGGAIALAAAADSVYDIMESDSKDKSKDIAKVAGGTTGALAGMASGAALGATAGSVVPGLGTAVGGVVGGIAGGFAGSEIGQYATDKVVDAGRYVGNAVTSTHIGAALTDPAFMAMNAVHAIWSEEARDTLMKSVNTTLIPDFKAVASDFADATKSFTDSVDSFASTAFGFGKAVVNKAISYATNPLATAKADWNSKTSQLMQGAESFSNSAWRKWSDITGQTKTVAGAPKALSALDLKAKSQATYGDALAVRESGGNSRAVNSLGYMGKYQFGKSALTGLGYMKADGTWTGKNGIYSQNDFLNNSKVQDMANEQFAKQNWSTLNKDALYYDKDGKGVFAKDLVGKTVAGQTITESGLLGASHLGGAGSVKEFLRTNGKSVAVDANGVPITNYMTTMGGKDVSNVTGAKSYTGPVLSAQFKGDENFYMPTSKGRVAVSFANAAGNNAVNAKLAGAVVPQGAQQAAPAPSAPVVKNAAAPTVKQATSQSAASKPTTKSADAPKNVKVGTAQPSYKVSKVASPAPTTVPPNLGKKEGTAESAASASESDVKEQPPIVIKQEAPQRAPMQTGMLPSLSNIPTHIDDVALLQLNMGLL